MVYLCILDIFRRRLFVLLGGGHRLFSSAAVSEGKQVGPKHKLAWKKKTTTTKNSHFVRAQEVDDVTRVSEAVAKVVVFALKGASSGDNADDWLNPTEVSLEHQSHVRSVTLCCCFLRDMHKLTMRCPCKTFAPTVAFSFSLFYFASGRHKPLIYFFSRQCVNCPTLPPSGRSCVLPIMRA